MTSAAAAIGASGRTSSRVTEVESRALALERDATLDLAALLAFQADLSRLKAEVLERFADDVLEGEELMSGFLAHVSDTRAYLAGLILHERDNLEERSRREGRAAPDLWSEALGPPRGPDPDACVPP
jgi:hypothetical protein